MEKLDDLQARRTANRLGLERVWRPLADKLDVHAYIEEKIFYPQLLERGADDPEGETLDAIKDHIASSLSIEQDDLNDVPFNQIGGLGRAYELFGDKLATILEDLNARLAA